jgi:hypothetical protein
MGFPLPSVAGAQQPVVKPVCALDEHSVPFVQRQAWPFIVPAGRHAPVAVAPVPVSPLMTVQHPFAAGQSLLVAHLVAHVLLPVPVSTQTALASQQLDAQGVWPPVHVDPPLDEPEPDDEPDPEDEPELDELPEEDPLDEPDELPAPPSPPPPVEDDDEQAPTTAAKTQTSVPTRRLMTPCLPAGTS